MQENQNQSEGYICRKEELHEYKFGEIMVTQQDHEIRIKQLEADRTEMRTEFANIKREMAETKFTILDVDRKSSAKWESLFGKVLDALNKREDNKFELTKGKIAVIIAIVTGVSTLGAIVLPHFFK